MTDLEITDMQDQINKEAGLDPEDGGVDVPDNTDGITRYPQVDGAPIPPDDDETGGSDSQMIKKMEIIMSSKEFVDAISNGSNLEAEDAFKSAMSQKIGDALENKRKELSKNYAQTVPATEEGNDEEV